MAKIDEYISARKEAERSIATLQRKVREAYDAAQATTSDGTYDDLEKLVDEGNRTAFIDKMISVLGTPLKASIDALPENGLIAETLLLGGFYGFTRDQITSYVSDAKEGTSFDGFMKTLYNSTQHKEKLMLRAQSPLSILDKVSPNDVFRYVGVTDTSHIVMDRVDLNAKAELLDAYEQLGSIPPKFLEKKPYWTPLTLSGGIIRP